MRPARPFGVFDSRVADILRRLTGRVRQDFTSGDADAVRTAITR
jgi:hypothetical protein